MAQMYGPPQPKRKPVPSGTGMPSMGQRPKMGGGMPGSKFMANGGMDSPSDMSTPVKQAPQANSDPDQDGDTDSGAVLTLADIDYHDDPHACSLCKHYDQSGMCEVVQEQVSPDGGCKVFAAAGDDSQTPPDQGSQSQGPPMGGGGGMGANNGSLSSGN